MIYLDNAATTFPKPPEVIAAVLDCLQNRGANPGRGGYQLAVAAAKVVFNAREEAARLFNISDSANLIFTLNATDALNTAIKGIAKPGSQVVTTTLEHNSVLRPLSWLSKHQGVKVIKIPVSARGKIDIKRLAAAVTAETSLIVVNHASNVIGNILPIADIATVARRRRVPLLVDAAQTAGSLPIDVEAMGIDLLAFTGHKALFGPQGTGGLYISPEIEVEELRQGGTGSDSSGPQPRVRPDRYESGTPNTPGLAGLGAGLEFVQKIGVATIFARERELTERLLAGLDKIKNLIYYGPSPGEERVPLVSVNIKGLSPHVTAHKLDKVYDIAVRAGLHCAPGAHKTIGTAPRGTARLSLSYFTTEDEVDAVLTALREIAQSAA